jgi:pilus assembly protein Flp/PilA
MPKELMNLLRTFAADESGTTAIEYGLIAAGIAAAVIATVNSVGSNMKAILYDKIGAALTGM